MNTKRNDAFTIRLAVMKDFEAVRVLEELEFNVHWKARPDYFKNAAQQYSRDEFEKLLSLPCPIAWLAVQGEQIIGLCFGKIDRTLENPICKSRKIAFVEDLVTRPEYRGGGVATALLMQAQEQAMAEGAEAIELCVWNFNKSALRLYERMGMQVQYCRMEKRLENPHKV